MHDPRLLCSSVLYMQMADGAGELQEAVVRLCSLWWQKELPGRGNMVPQMIPYLLYQATVSGTPSDCTQSPAQAALRSLRLHVCMVEQAAGTLGHHQHCPDAPQPPVPDHCLRCFSRFALTDPGRAAFVPSSAWRCNQHTRAPQARACMLPSPLSQVSGQSAVTTTEQMQPVAMGHDTHGQ